MLLAQQENRRLIEFTLTPLSEDTGIPLAVMGVVVVFMALVLVAVFITLLPRMLGLLSQDNQAESVPSPTIPGDELSPATVAVIAAAVAAVVDRPHRVLRIRGLTPGDVGWSLEGRTQHHQSHRVHHRDHR